MNKSSPPSPETEVNSGPVTLIMSKKYRKAFYVLACIVLGNISYYMLRAHFQITKPEMERQGILNDESYGSILIGSYFVNIIGKPLGGFFADYWKRPKLSFVVCIFLTVACTLIVTLVPQYDPIAVLWCLGRLFTTMGRMNVIKIVSSIFPSTVMGTVMGIITVSCSVGEAVAKVTLSQLLNFLSWQHMFYVASGLTLLLMSPTIFYVKDSKIREACRNKENEKKENAALNATLSSVEIIPPAPIHDEKKLDVKFSTPSMLASPIAALKPHQLFLAKMRTLFIMPRFLLILVMACTITIIREAIGAWAIPFLTKMLGYPSSASGTIHGLFSLVSAASSLIAGRAIDSIPRRHRGLFFAAYMFGVAIFQLSLTLFISQNNITSTGVFPDNIVVTTSSMATSTIQAVVVAFLFLSEFCLGPPVSFIDGVFIIDLVEPNLVSFASGLVGSFGYLGAICVTHPLRVWAGNLEYTSLWALSSSCGFACAMLSVLYYWLDKRMQAAAAGRKNRVSNL